MVDYALHNEKQLLLDVSEGDEQSFRELVNQYGKKIFPFLVKFTDSEVVAEDLSQDVFLKVWLWRDRLPEIEHFTAWIFTITANTAHSWLRKKMNERKFLSNNAATEPLTHSYEIDYKELNELFQKAIQSLPPKRRQIYVMQRVNKMKIDEVATALDITASTVKNSTVTAVKEIREYLKAHGVTVSLSLFLALILP